jgi:hypothetical protein
MKLNPHNIAQKTEVIVEHCHGWFGLENRSRAVSAVRNVSVTSTGESRIIWRAAGLPDSTSVSPTAMSFF